MYKQTICLLTKILLYKTKKLFLQLHKNASLRYYFIYAWNKWVTKYINKNQSKPKFRDYTVGGPESILAVKKGLASGKWFLPYVERSVMRRLMARDDYHATRDCIILLAILLTTFTTSYYCWQTGRYGLFALFFWLHCTFYTSCGDSRSIILPIHFFFCVCQIPVVILAHCITPGRWHETVHGTAFKTKWKNRLLYNIASFMVGRHRL